MFSVEIMVPDDALLAIMTSMREWLDHHRSQPSLFRYMFLSPGIAFRVNFSAESEAIAFAAEFGGRVVGGFADTAPPTAA